MANNVDVELLPHQKIAVDNNLVLSEILVTKDKMWLGRIESDHDKAMALDEDDPTRQKKIDSAIASSEKLADIIAAHIEKTAANAQTAQANNEKANELLPVAAQQVAENNWDGAIETYGQILALNISEEQNATCNAEIEKITGFKQQAIDTAAQNKANEDAQSFNNFIESAGEKFTEGDLDTAEALYNSALALNINEEANTAVQEKLDLIKEARAHAENAVAVQGILKDIDHHLKAKGTITQDKLAEFGILEYDKEAAAIKLGDNNAVGAELDLVKVSPGVYRLHTALPEPAGKGNNTLKWIIGGLAGAGVLTLLYLKVIKPWLDQRKAANK